jgi:hypothetical protein
MRSGRGLHLARAGSFPARSLRCKNPIVLTSRELHRVRMIAGEWHEIPGPLVIDAQVGGIDYFRGEHIIGALLCQGFDVVAIASTSSTATSGLAGLVRALARPR